MLWVCPTSSRARAAGQAWPHQGPGDRPGQRGIGISRRRAGPRNSRSRVSHARWPPADRAARSPSPPARNAPPGRDQGPRHGVTPRHHAASPRDVERLFSPTLRPSPSPFRIPGKAIFGTPFQYVQYIRNGGPWTRASVRTGKICPPGGAFLGVQPPHHPEPAASVTGNGGRHQAPEAASAHSATPAPPGPAARPLPMTKRHTGASRRARSNTSPPPLPNEPGRPSPPV